MPLVTDRLHIRPLRHTDIAALQRIGGNPAVARNLWHPTSPWPAQAVADWIAASLWRNRLGFGLGFRLGIALRGTPADLIGAIGVGGNPVNLSYFIDPAQQGRGFATAAATAVLNLCHDHFGLNVMVADHFDDNPASARVLHKLGFVITGHEMGTSAVRPNPAPVTVMRRDLG